MLLLLLALAFVVVAVVVIVSQFAVVVYIMRFSMLSRYTILLHQNTHKNKKTNTIK